MDSLPVGVEIRGESLRISFVYKGIRCRQTLKGLKPTPKNLKLAEQKRNAILYEINSGKFDYSQHFPDSENARLFSPHGLRMTTVKEATQRWLARKENTTAQSTFRSYKSKANYHVIQRWGDHYVQEISKTDLEDWIDIELHHLANKTINDVLTVLRGAFADYKDDNPAFLNPLERIPNKPLNEQEIDPFTREEIKRMSEVQTKRVSERNMIEFAIWSGLSVSEVIALAWEDVNLVAGEVNINRARVHGNWKSPKERSRRRVVELTTKAKDVLIRQSELSESCPIISIDVTQSDNKTVRSESIRPVFVRTNSKTPFKNDFMVRDRFFKAHLKKAGVRYRAPNNCRHTYASQMLTLGLPKVWVAEQLGHKNTDMIDKHYGRWIREDAPRMAELASRLLDETEDQRILLPQGRPIT